MPPRLHAFEGAALKMPDVRVMSMLTDREQVRAGGGAASSELTMESL
jgi:hypothetical protein